MKLNTRQRNRQGKAGRVFVGRQLGSYTVVKLFGSDRPTDRIMVECACGERFIVTINAAIHGAQRCFDCGMKARSAAK